MLEYEAKDIEMLAIAHNTVNYVRKAAYCKLSA